MTQDAGVTKDAGPSDAGQSRDAGSSDAGSVMDAGQPADAGTPDAGIGSDGGSGSATYAQVFAILNMYCAGCHTSGGTGSSQGNLDFSDATATYSELVNQLATGPLCKATPHTLVIPGDPTNSLLYQKVHGTQDCGTWMPWGEPPHRPPPLSMADQQIIYDWIVGGAQSSP